MLVEGSRLEVRSARPGRRCLEEGWLRRLWREQRFGKVWAVVDAQRKARLSRLLSKSAGAVGFVAAVVWMSVAPGRWMR